MPFVTLPYAPDDDEAADRLINTAVRSRDAKTWRLLTAPEYVVQTERVLRRKLDLIKTSFTHRKADLNVQRQRRTAGEITHEELEVSRQDYFDWLARTEYFETTVRQYLRLASDIARKVRGDDVRDELLTTLKNIVGAVHRHKIDTLLAELEPTPADRVLWARLSVLTVRLDETSDPVSLRDLLQQSEPETTVIRDDANAVSEITVMAARLLLELAADAESVPRTELVAEWGVRANHIGQDSGPHRTRKSPAKVLYQCLRKWERNGIVRRVGDEASQAVFVVDRDRLRQLCNFD